MRWRHISNGKQVSRDVHMLNTLVLVWWFVVATDVAGHTNDVGMKGPFPTKAVCETAQRYLFPDEDWLVQQTRQALEMLPKDGEVHKLPDGSSAIRTGVLTWVSQPTVLTIPAGPLHIRLLQSCTSK